MTNWQKNFHESILELNNGKLIMSLSMGAKMNNGQNKKNTLNFAIKSLLNKHNIENFNLGFIEELFNHGAIICNIGKFNLLSIIITQYRYVINVKYPLLSAMAKENVYKLLNYVIIKGAKSLDYDILSDVILTHDTSLIELIFKSKPLLNNHALSDTVRTHNLETVKILCNNGILPDLSQTENNTMSLAVQTKNLNLVLLVCKFGALPNTSLTFDNTLSLAVQTNDLNIVDLVCRFGALPDTSQAVYNTLSLAVLTQNINIINLVCRFGALPDTSQGVYNTLSLAVRTKNINIVEIVCENGALPDNKYYDTYSGQYGTNTLDMALLTKNPDIVYEILIKGGKTNIAWSLFLKIYDSEDKCKINYDRIMNLLMCTGHIINNYDYFGILLSENSCIKSKIIDCYSLINHHLKISKDNINNLKKDLKATMDEIMEGKILKREVVDLIDIGMHSHIPLPCVNIIYEYKRSLCLVEFIDWSKY